MRNRRFIAPALSLLVSAFAACSSDSLDANPNQRASTGDAGVDGSITTATTNPNAIPFEAVGPSTYVPKVKNLLTGLAASDDEVKAVVADPTALRGLIDKWMGLPSFQVRMLDFLRNAFQQNQVTLDQLQLNLGTNFIMNNAYQARLQRNLMDSFGLTVWQLLQQGHPFSEAFTTHSYMMTTAMESLLSFVDDQHRDDANKVTNRLITRNAIPTYTLDTASAVPIEQSLDPTSSNYMKFHFLGTQPAGCATTAQVFTQPTQTNNVNYYNGLFDFFMGKYAFNPCGMVNPPQLQYQPVYSDNDWTDWHMVTVKVDTAAASASPAFYQLPALRTASELTLHTDRMSFFGTLAFAANWGTNVTNEDRVTANQSLIVGIGQSIAGEDTLTMFPVNATDQDHATNPACVGCHAQLDPYKQFFRQSYSLWYSDQTDPVQQNTPAGFSIDGVTTTGSGHGVDDLGKIFATHPRMPLAWANKLIFWANSTAALDSDPELVRIAKAFSDSQFDFKTLVREVFSSPLVTWSAATATTTTNGVILSIARRDQFCASLSNRMGLTDVCGMSSVALTSQQSTIATRALLLPSDTYYRAFALPSLPTNPDLFFRQSTEAICSLVAAQVVDAGTTSKYQSANADDAITDFVTTVMAIPPSDPRAAPAKAILTDNFTQGKAGGANATQALQATFTLACLSPTSVIVGL